MHKALHDLQVNSTVARHLLKLPKQRFQSTIISIQLAEPRKLASYLQDRGMNVRPVVFPTVPLGTQRIRVCLHAGNTVEDVEKLVQKLAEWCEICIQKGDDEMRQKSSVEARL